MRYFYTFLALLMLSFSANAQLTNSTDSPEIKALNNYIFFANECTHGMLIVHGLLYRFNQDLNQQIDLDSYQVNFYSNKDLPKDIFADTWFYDIAPYDWYTAAVTSSNILPTKHATSLNSMASQLKAIVLDINNVRFSLENMVKADMNDPENVLTVYKELERASDLYTEFYLIQNKLHEEVIIVFNEFKSKIDIEFSQLMNLLNETYQSSYSILNTVYGRTNIGVSELANIFEKNIQKLDSLDLSVLNSSRLLSREIQSHYLNLQKQCNELLNSTNNFLNHVSIPKEYKMYGPYYYYYNKEMISKFNRFGIGIVFEINSILDYLESNQLRFMEVPHFYQVDYSKKIERIGHLRSTSTFISALPDTLSKRNISHNNNVIQIEGKEIILELNDHFIQDGDIVSLNFNGDWVVDSLLLENKPYELKLSINPFGKNFIILHAENVGSRPPNTMAVSYYINGRKKQIIMKADLNTSELIEIR